MCTIEQLIDFRSNGGRWVPLETVYEIYCTFGEAPWMPGVKFSDWTYAKPLVAKMGGQR